EADSGAVAAGLAGDQVHDALEHEDGLGLAGAAVGRDGHSMRIDAGKAHLDVGDAVGPAQRRGGEQRHHEPARRVGAGVVDELVAQSEHAALVVAHTVSSPAIALYSATSPRVSMGWPPARPIDRLNRARRGAAASAVVTSPRESVTRPARLSGMSSCTRASPGAVGSCTEGS